MTSEEQERWSEPGRHYEIAAVDIYGSPPRRLTSNNRLENYPAWSPDGTQIAFLSTLEYRFMREYFLGQVLYIMAGDGSNIREIYSSERNDGIIGFAPSPPLWSPDGQRLAFIAKESPYPDGRVLYTVGVDGADPHRLVAVTSPASWSPDGSQLAFAKLDGEYSSLYVSNPDGTEMQVVLPSGETSMPRYTISQVYWSPDGSEILFIASEKTVHELGSWFPPALASLYLIRADGSALRTLGARDLLYTVASWSPDGSQFAVRVDHAWEGILGSYEEFNLIVMSRDGTNPVTLTISRQ